MKTSRASAVPAAILPDRPAPSVRHFGLGMVGPEELRPVTAIDIEPAVPPHRAMESDARPMGRNTSGVKGIELGKEDKLVGMVVTDPAATLLTVCENGYGKRTPFGPNSDEAEAEADTSSSAKYRCQKRGGKGLRDIKATDRNGPVIGIARVDDDNEIIMMTSRGKLQRIRVSDISIIGRNTQGVRIMNLDEGDQLAAVVPVAREEVDETEVDETGIAAGDTAASDSEATPMNDPPADSDVTPTAEDDEVTEDDNTEEDA